MATITGTSGNDTYNGTTGNDFLVASAGNDIINGNGGYDSLTYSFMSGPVVVTFSSAQAGTALKGGSSSGTDSFSGISSVTGSPASDTITGGSGDDYFVASTGNDTYDGGNGSNGVTYGSYAGPINATFSNPAPGLTTWANASVAKPNSQTDTLTNFNYVYGTSGDDLLSGISAPYSWNFVLLRGGAGNDTINGQNDSNNLADYGGATAAVTVDLAAGTAQDGQGGTDSLVNVLGVRSSSHDDMLYGGSGNDGFNVVASGNHTVDGRGGTNTVRYSGSNDVTIDLGSTTAAPGSYGGYVGSITKSGGTDTLYNISNATGGGGDDTIIGTPGDNLLGGSGGNNLLDGLAGYDSYNIGSFVGSGEQGRGGTVNLGDGVNGTAINPYGGTDTLRNIEGARGGAFADDITGAVLAGGAVSYIRGNGGDDTLRAPTPGTHVTADYAGSLSRAVVDLGAGVASDDGWFGGRDTLVNIEAVRGSSHDDILTGGGTDDVLEGAGGNDTLDGGGGTDIAVYKVASSAATWSRSGDGWRVTAKGLGSDTVRNVETLRFNDRDVTLSPLPAPTGASLFDASYYLARNPDVAQSGMDPYQHYLQYGAAEGRDPNALFSTGFYLARNADVAAAGINPLLHYVQHGVAEGRDPDAYFSTSYYLSHNPDVAAAGVDPLLHYEQNGWLEGRDPSATFSSKDYLAANPDVAAAGVDPLAHFLSYGLAEGRAAFAVAGGGSDPLVDAAYYYLQSPDVKAAGVDASAHYAQDGWREGRNPDAFFDTSYYLSHNQDVAQAGVDPLAHYEQYGWKEGRDPSAQFSTNNYLAAYQDVKAAGANPLAHYLTFGQAEGRMALAA